MVVATISARAMSGMPGTRSLGMLGRLQSRDQLALLAEVARPVEEMRPQAGILELALQLAGAVLAGDLVDEEVLQGDHLALHAEDLGDMSDLARAVAQAL